MWRRYFKLVKLVPGKVIVQGYGTLDFAGDIPVETCKALYETDFEFLEITALGKKELYGIAEENPPLIPPFSKGDEEKEPVTEKRRAGKKKKVKE
jgi:hypothetical protein